MEGDTVSNCLLAENMLEERNGSLLPGREGADCILDASVGSRPGKSVEGSMEAQWMVSLTTISTRTPSSLDR